MGHSPDARPGAPMLSSAAMTTTPPPDPLDDASTVLSSNRTAMSFERTRMSTDRTLMSVVRTALSLISFGFTIYQFIGKFTPEHPQAEQSARNFGIILILLGIATLTFGLISDALSLTDLRARRNRLYAAGLLRHGQSIRPSPTTIIALCLLVVGLVAVWGMILRMGPLE
jgi:putative membrane protein